MARFTKEMEIEIFFAACKFIRAKDSFEINKENFPYTAARAFKLYKSFMEVGKNGRSR